MPDEKTAAAVQSESVDALSKWVIIWRELFPIVLLIIVCLAVYANAWPDVLVHDDKFFAGKDRFPGLAELPRIFTEKLWAASAVQTELYRPLLILSLAFDARIHGDWMAGYHLSNIFLHAVATVLAYGLIRQLLWMADGPSRSTDYRYALLAALVYAVHPIHTEVVNSLYNRSDILVAIAGTGGLWWFLRKLESGPVRAWAGLALAYLAALFSKESAIVLPGLAVALVLIFTQGSWTLRIRRCLPVLCLLLPLALFLELRAQALAPPVTTEVTTEVTMEVTTEVTGIAAVEGANQLLELIGMPGWKRILKAAGVLGQSFKLAIWPDPVAVYYDLPGRFWQWVSLVMHGVLLALAVLSCRRKQFGLLAGLLFFYLAILPAIRLFDFSGDAPHLALRYLYFPSVGLALLLAFGLRFIGRRFGLLMSIAPVVLAVMVMAPLTWARNAEWASEIRLFESDFNRGLKGGNLLRLLTGAYLQEGKYSKVGEICDEYSYEHRQLARYANHCAVAYSRLGQTAKAEEAYLLAAKSTRARAVAHANLARMYMRQNRRTEAEQHFQLAVEAERNPARRAYRQGLMIVRLYPSDRAKLMEAREHFVEALRLQPQMASARRWLERLDRFLGTSSG